MFKYILPKGKIEYILFFFLFIFYFITSYHFIFNTSVIDSLELGSDIYFSYDNPDYYHHAIAYVSGHPLLYFFTYPLVFIGNIFKYVTGLYKLKTLFLACFCNVMISASSIYIYRYLKQIILLDEKKSFLIILMYSVFSTNLVLSFTFESFTFSIFFISFTIYYFSFLIKEGKSIPLYSCILLPVIVGGITITNFIIALFPIILSKDSISNKIKKVITPSSIFFIILLIAQLKKEYFSYQDRLTIFSVVKNYFKDSVDLFGGSPILFPTIKTYINETFHKGKELITTDYYSYWFQYLTIGLITIFVLFSIIRGYKNKLIIICSFTLTINIIIHIIIKYGLSEPFIYGGHWVFIVPILLGWTYSYIRYKNVKKILFSLYMVMFAILLINNLYRMLEFKEVAERMFPAY